MSSPKGCNDGNQNPRNQPRTPPPARPCPPPAGYQGRPRSASRSPPRPALPFACRPRMGQGPPPNPYRPASASPVRNVGMGQTRTGMGMGMMGSPDLNLMTSGEMASTFDCGPGGGISTLFSSEESGGVNTTGARTYPSSYYSNTTGTSMGSHPRIRTTTSTTIITTEEDDEDDDEDEDDDDDMYPGGGGGGGAGGRTYTCSPPQGRAGGGGGGTGGYGGNVTYIRAPSPQTQSPCSGGCPSSGMDYSDFDYSDFDSTPYSSGGPSMGMYPTYTVDPGEANQRSMRGPIPGPGCPGGAASGAGPSGAHNKTYIKTVKKVVTESPSSDQAQQTRGPGGGGGGCNPSPSQGQHPGAMNDFQRGIRAHSTPNRFPSSPSGQGQRTQVQGCPAARSANRTDIAAEVQRHLDELECTERTQINSELATFQQARRRLVEATTTISSTQPPMSFATCPPGGPCQQKF